MSIKIIGGDPEEYRALLEKVESFTQQQDLPLTLEWISGQFWLHSQRPKEAPIGVAIDEELRRHQHYFQNHSLLKEPLARAIGVKSGHRPRVLDLSAGLLGDSLLFLSFGCTVWALERHPVVALLIQSALKGAQHPRLESFKFIHSDARDFLLTTPEVDVVFFDPMFEDANQKSLPKKEMRIFRDVVGADEDAQGILAMARGLGCKRVVVKRPRLSKVLAPDPDLQVMGKSTRYDVYLKASRGESLKKTWNFQA
jgi:16S rRNA (guanine1516-N2)-methyltransferase